MPDSSFQVEQPEDSIGFLFWQVSTLWQRNIKKVLDQEGIAHAQFVILAVLLWFEEHGECVTQATLIQWTKLDKMTVSKSLKKLIENGFVYREIDTTDTRFKRVSLKNSGKALIKTLVASIEEVDAVFFQTLEKEEQKMLLSMLQKLIRSKS